MTKEEWQAEFERLNGRPATEAEIAQGWQATQQEAAEDTVAVQADSAPATMTTETPNYFQSAQLSTSKQSPKKMGAIAAGVVAILALLGFVYWFNNSRNSIDGQWHSQQAAQQIASEYESAGIEEYLNDIQATLDVKGKKAVIKVTMKADLDLLKEDFSDYYDDQESFLDDFEDGMRTTLGDGVKFDHQTGRIEMTVFEGRVNFAKKQIVITKSNLDELEEDSVLSYTVKDGKLSFKSQNGSDNLVFEK